MPGKIIAVEVTKGQAVTKGQKLLTLEAMKMEHSLVAPFDGVVAELSAVAGAQVQVEALLARIEAARVKRDPSPHHRHAELVSASIWRCSPERRGESGLAVGSLSAPSCGRGESMDPETVQGDGGFYAMPECDGLTSGAVRSR